MLCAGWEGHEGVRELGDGVGQRLAVPRASEQRVARHVLQKVAGLHACIAQRREERREVMVVRRGAVGPDAECVVEPIRDGHTQRRRLSCDRRGARSLRPTLVPGTTNHEDNIGAGGLYLATLRINAMPWPPPMQRFGAPQASR